MGFSNLGEGLGSDGLLRQYGSSRIRGIARYRFRVDLIAVHVPGVLADAISRDNVYLPGPSGQPGTVQTASDNGVPPNGPAPGLASSHLEGVVRSLFSAGLAQREYRTGSNRYLKCCRTPEITPFPASEQSLCGTFVCGKAGCSPNRPRYGKSQGRGNASTGIRYQRRRRRFPAYQLRQRFVVYQSGKR